jgi:hypothetical protein
MPSASPNIARRLFPIAVLLCGTEFSFAQLPLARLSTLFPPGGKTGTTFEVAVTGVDLDEANQLYFSSTNIAAKQKLAEKTSEPEPNKFLVTVGADVAPGICEARVVGRFGVSNPRPFVVADLPELLSPTTNHTAESATEITLGTVVNGRADASAIDYFKFTAKKDQRVLVECLARDIDSRMDDSLVLYDARGRELERRRRGGLLDFIAPADGEFVLGVSDFTYRGGEEYFYRLTIGAGPHVDYIFPPSGLGGSNGKYTLYGRNLPGSTPATGLSINGKPLEQLDVEIALPAADALLQQTPPPDVLSRPCAAAVDGIEYRLRTQRGVSNPVFLGLAAAPVVTEQEPNNQPGQSQRITLPCEVVGQFYPAGDRDSFVFDAKKGDVYWIEMYSHRLGLPTSPFALLQHITKNDKGDEKASDVRELYASDTNIGGPEFSTANRDPAWRFEVTEDGMYRLQVRDLFNRDDNDPRFIYRLSLHKEAPDFRLVALPQAPPPVNKDAKEAALWTPFLRRGETIPIKVLVFRRDNFDGDIELSVEGLPQGVGFASAKIAAKKTSGFVLLTAAEDASAWSGPIRVTGKAKIGETEVTRQARAGSITWNVPDYNNEAVDARLTRELYLDVSSVENTPIAIAPADSKIQQATAGRKLQIPLKLARHFEFNETLKLKAMGETGLEGLKEFDVDGKTNAATLEIDLSQQKLAPGTHTFWLQTQTKGKYRNDPEAAREAADAAGKAEKLATELSAEAKKTAEVLAAATKAADEAAAQTKSVSEGEKAAASEKATTAAKAKDDAAKTNEDATAKAKEAEDKKASLQKRAKELDEKAKPREVTITVYSAPITIQVKADEKK